MEEARFEWKTSCYATTEELGTVIVDLIERRILRIVFLRHELPEKI